VHFVRHIGGSGGLALCILLDTLEILVVLLCAIFELVTTEVLVALCIATPLILFCKRRSRGFGGFVLCSRSD
jgi:hypothetical protein